MMVNNSSNVRDSCNYHINYHGRLTGLQVIQNGVFLSLR